MQEIIGLFVFLSLCVSLSSARSEISTRFTLWGLSIHAFLAFVLIKVEAISKGFGFINEAVIQIQKATEAGSRFVFGYLGGERTPFEIVDSSQTYIFAFQVLPQVILFSVIVSLLWHWRILPFFIRTMSFFLSKTLGLRGPLSTAAVSSIFLGMVEAPLIIRAYLNNLSKSDFFALMTLGMSTVAGSMLVLYASVLREVSEVVISQIISASLMNVIGAVYVSRILVPETSLDRSTEQLRVSFGYESTMDALTKGTTDGVRLAINVGAMVLVLISLVALVNGALALFENLGIALSLELLFGWLFAPIAWLIGVPWVDAMQAGALLGVKLVLNELVAFVELSEISNDLTEHTRQVMLFALCGFANFGSLGILIGGLYVLVPERRAETIRIAPMSIFSGTVVSLLTASLVSFFLNI